MLKTEKDISDITIAQISKAATMALGKKCCFSCQTWKPLDQGSSQVYKKNRWRCFACQNKLHPLKGQK